MHQLTILTLMFSSVGMHLMKHYFAKKIYCKNKWIVLSIFCDNIVIFAFKVNDN
jgi:hypothetical protein